MELIAIQLLPLTHLQARYPSTCRYHRQAGDLDHFHPTLKSYHLGRKDSLIFHHLDCLYCLETFRVFP